MKRSTKFIYGITIALITAASLHFTVGHRFHGRSFGNYGPNGYSSHSQGYDRFNHSECGPNDQERQTDGRTDGRQRFGPREDYYRGDRRNQSGLDNNPEKLPLQSAPAETLKDSF